MKVKKLIEMLTKVKESDKVDVEVTDENGDGGCPNFEVLRNLETGRIQLRKEY